MHAPRAPHTLTHTHHCARSDVHHLIVQAHLAPALKEHIELLDARVAMPVARLLTRFQGIRGHADVLHGQFMIDDASAGAR